MSTAPKQLKHSNLACDITPAHVSHKLKSLHQIFSLIRPQFTIKSWMYLNFSLMFRSNHSERISFRKKNRIASWRDCNTTILTVRQIRVVLDSEKMKKLVDDIRNGFKRMKGLKSIRLDTGSNFSHSSSLANIYKKLATAIKTLNDLRRISIRGDDSSDDFLKNWVPIFLAIRGMKKPEILDLHLDKTSPVEIPCFNSLKFLTRNLALVETLTLIFNSAMMTLPPQKIISFFSGLKSIRKILICQEDKKIDITKSILLGLNGLEAPDHPLQFLKLIASLEESELDLIQRFPFLKKLKTLIIFSNTTIGQKSKIFELAGKLSESETCSISCPGQWIYNNQGNYKINLEGNVPKSIDWTLIQDFKSMIKLSLDFKQTCFYNVSDLISALKLCQNLQSFSLVIDSRVEIKIGSENLGTDQTVNHLDKMIDESLPVMKTENIPEKSAVVLVKCIETEENYMELLKNLQSLNLVRIEFDHLKVGNTDLIESFKTSLYKKTELKNLQFVSPDKSVFESYFEVFKDGLHHWKSLEYGQIKDSSRLIEIQNLQKLNINLKIDGLITINLMSQIRDILPQLSNLKKLQIELRKSKSDIKLLKFLQHLFKNPQKMAQLQEFIFSQDHFSDIGSEGVLELCQFLSQISHATLNILKINLGCAGDINRQAFETLIATIGNFVELKVISLDLSMKKTVNTQARKDLEIDTVEQCIYPSDKELKAMGNMFKELTQLEEIDMDFKHNYEITGGQVKELVDVFSGLENLKKVDIGFYGCKKVKKVDLKTLVELVEKLKLKITK